MEMKELINKYGLIVILSVVLLVIGVALYLWKKDEKGEDDKKIATAGIAIAIVGGTFGIGSIAYTAMQEKADTPPPDNGDNGGDDAGGGI